MNGARSIVVAGALALLMAEAAWLRALRKPTVPVQGPATTGLALQVQREGRSLQLSWDRNSESIHRSSHAVLYINDGIHNSHLDLNGTSLGAGRLVYWPETDHVTFRLELAASSGVIAGTIQTPGQPIQTRGERPIERKPSPFVPRRHGIQKVSAEVLPDVAPESNSTPAARPAGSLLGRLAHRIPLVRRIQKSPHRVSESSD